MIVARAVCTRKENKGLSIETVLFTKEEKINRGFSHEEVRGENS